MDIKSLVPQMFLENLLGTGSCTSYVIDNVCILPS